MKNVEKLLRKVGRLLTFHGCCSFCPAKAGHYVVVSRPESIAWGQSALARGGGGGIIVIMLAFLFGLRYAVAAPNRVGNFVDDDVGARVAENKMTTNESIFQILGQIRQY